MACPVINAAYQKMGMMYEKSRAMAVIAKIALTAMALARSSRPGRIETTVTSQMARRGVRVLESMWPKKPRSGRPLSRLKAYTVRETAWRAVWHTKNAVKHTNTQMKSAPGLPMRKTMICVYKWLAPCDDGCVH